MPDQPLELLSSARFAKIIEQLSTHYDRIVLDCAPTQAVSDALVLSQLSDAVVYNVKSHDTSIELVKRGLHRLSQVNAKIAGVLITQVDIDKIVSYGGDHYYQGYYDYYGYNTKGESFSNKLELSREDINRIRDDETDIEFDFGMQESNGEGRHINGNGTNGIRRVVANGARDHDIESHVQSSQIARNGYDIDATHMMDFAGINETTTDSSSVKRQVQPKHQFSDDLDLL